MITPKHYETVFAGDDLRTVAQARRWTREVLTGAGLPDGLVDDALTCVSEMAGNAARHTRSGEPGGKYRVVVETLGRVRAHVEVVDQGGDGSPEVMLGGGESHRGLWICAQLGVLHTQHTPGGCRVWVDLPHPSAARPQTPIAPTVLNGLVSDPDDDPDDDSAAAAHGPDGSER